MLHAGTCLLLVLTPSTSGLRILSRAFAPAKASDVLSSLAADAAVIEAGGAGVIDAYGESSGWLKSFEAQIAEALGTVGDSTTVQLLLELLDDLLLRCDHRAHVALGERRRRRRQFG